MHGKWNGTARRAAAVFAMLALAVVAIAPVAADENAGVLEVPACARVVGFFEDHGVSGATVGKTYDQLTPEERQAIRAIEDDAVLSETLKSIVSTSLKQHLGDGVFEVHMLVAGSVFGVARY
jgi:hypothetical protein